MAFELEVVVARVSVLQGGDIPKQMLDARIELEKILGTQRRIIVLPTTGDTQLNLMYMATGGSIVEQEGAILGTGERQLLKG